jgi:hypothetical protein
MDPTHFVRPVRASMANPLHSPVFHSATSFALPVSGALVPCGVHVDDLFQYPLLARRVEIGSLIVDSMPGA